jgi:DNA polymerase-3 subunit delta
MSKNATSKLAGFYLLSGDEPLLLQEARDQLCQRAYKNGFSDRQILTIESASDWQQLLSMTQNLGLFSERQLIDIRNPSAKFDKQTQRILQEYTASPNPDCLIILSCGKLTAAQKKAKWFKAIEPHIKTQFIWPLQPRELPAWLQNRLKQHNLTADRDALKLLVELTEGNLLATNQALQKLAMLYSGQHITIEMMSQVIHDSAQFNVFDLANYALAGNTARAIHAVDTIQASGGEPVLVLWALSREIRELYSNVYQYERGAALATLTAKQWANRKPVMQRAIQRLSLSTLKNLLKLSHQTDLIIKGAEPGNAWLNLKTLTATLTGALA